MREKSLTNDENHSIITEVQNRKNSNRNEMGMETKIGKVKNKARTEEKGYVSKFK